MQLSKMEIFALEMVTFYMREIGLHLNKDTKADKYDELMDMIGSYVDGT